MQKWFPLRLETNSFLCPTISPILPITFTLFITFICGVMPGILGERNNLPKPVSDKTCSRAIKMRNHHKQPWATISETLGGRVDWGMTTTKHTCTNKMKLDYVNCSVTSINVSFISRLWRYLSGGQLRTLSRLGFLKLHKSKQTEGKVISHFFSLNSLLFVTLPWRPAWSANSSLLSSLIPEVSVGLLKKALLENSV